MERIEGSSKHFLPERQSTNVNAFCSAVAGLSKEKVIKKREEKRMNTLLKTLNGRIHSLPSTDTILKHVLIFVRSKPQCS